MFSVAKERVNSEQMRKLKIPFELLYHLIINLKYAYMAEHFSNVSKFYGPSFYWRCGEILCDILF